MAQASADRCRSAHRERGHRRQGLQGISKASSFRSSWADVLRHPDRRPIGGGQGEEMFRSLMVDQYGKRSKRRAASASPLP